MDDHEALDAVHKILNNCSEHMPEPGYIMTGGLVIGMYANPETGETAIWDHSLGVVNFWTKRGILDDLIQRSRLQGMED